MAKMPVWPVWFVIAIFIPFLDNLGFLFIIVMCIIWTWKILEFRKKQGWWSIFVIIPVFGWIWWLILWGIIAWGKD